MNFSGLFFDESLYCHRRDHHKMATIDVDEYMCVLDDMV